MLPRDVNVIFGCLNIRSVANKMDDLVDVRRDQLMDVMFWSKYGTTVIASVSDVYALMDITSWIRSSSLT